MNGKVIILGNKAHCCIKAEEVVNYNFREAGLSVAHYPSCNSVAKQQ